MGDHRPSPPWRLVHHGSLVALGCGILAGVALPPLGLPPLLWLALAGLWGLPPRQAVLWGGAAVLISHGWLLWLHPLDWVGVPLPLSLPLCWALLLACAAVGGLLVGCWRWLVEALGPHRLSTALIGAALWGLAELALSRGPLFWIGLGAAALPGDRALAGFGQVVGAGGLASLQILFGWAVWSTVRAARLGRPLWWRPAALWLLLVLLLHGFGWQRILAAARPDPSADSLRLLVLQPSIPTRRKFHADQQLRLRRELLDAQDRAERLGSRILVLPEGALGLMEPLPRQSTVDVLSGGFRRQGEQLRSALLAFPSGSRQPRFALDKHRLVPLGEWIPAAGLLNWTGLSAVGGLSPGAPSRLFPLPSGALAVAICYEIADGLALAEAVRDGALWLVASANLDPYPAQLQRQFAALAQLRAIETGRWLVSSANTGPSLVVDASGQVRRSLPMGIAGTLDSTVERRSATTAYVSWGPTPLLLLLSTGLLLRVSPARLGRSPL